MTEMAGVANKRRKVSARVAEKASENIIANTTEIDNKYIQEQLSKDPTLVPQVAGLLRSGTLKRALNQQQADDPQFAPSAFYMKNMGVKFAKRMLMQLEPSIFSDAVLTEYALSYTDLLRLLFFGLNCSGDTFLPDISHATAARILTEHYKNLGSRLAKADLSRGWAVTGWYVLDLAKGEVICSVTEHRKSIKLPYGQDMLQKYDDWEIISNWSRSATLRSSKALAETNILKAFEMEYGADMSKYVPAMVASFEKDHKSPPASLGVEATSSKRVRRTEAKKQAQPKASAFKSSSVSKPRAPTGAGGR